MTPEQIRQKIYKSKIAMRKQQSDLSIGEKILIVIKLQKMSNEIRTAAGRPLKYVWGELNRR